MVGSCSLDGILSCSALQIRNELEKHMNCNLKEFKEFIDNEMLLILGQMDKPSLIFDHLYLVSSSILSCALQTARGGSGRVLCDARWVF